MAILLSSLAQRGSGGQTDFHAIRRDADGMLIYTKVTPKDADSIDLVTQTKLDANGNPIFRTLDDFTLDLVSGQPVVSDPDIDPYYQYKFDSRDLSYFIDEDGQMVARMGRIYNYSTNGPK